MTAASDTVGETGCNETNNQYHLSHEDSAALRNLSSVLSACCADEVHHQHEAAAVAPPPAAADRVKVRLCCRLFEYLNTKPVVIDYYMYTMFFHGN
jgi:hypothetical protein